MSSNTYAIAKWQLVNPTYGTYGDYVYTSSVAYDQFFMYEGTNDFYVYIVKKLTSGFTAASSSSSTYGYISSYYRWGQLRFKHHRHNSNKMYLLRKPHYKEYTTSVNTGFVQSHRVANYFGTWSMYDMDTQVKINGWNGWQFASINAGNNMGGYSAHADDPS